MRRSACERILLVEGHQMGRRARQVVLEEFGCEVVAVCCAVDAMERFDTQHFDLVVTAYELPHVNGIELTRRIRERSPGTRVVLISGLAEVLGLNESNTGADIVIQKSCFEVSALTQAVGRLRTRTARKPVRRQPAGTYRKAASRAIR